MSCSKVTPMPPWSWTHSCSSSEPYCPMNALAALARRSRRRARRPPPPRRPGRLMAWLAWSQRVHVGVPVLERLVGRQRASEGVPVEGPLHGHVEGGLHDADGLGVREHQRDLELALDLGARPRPPSPTTAVAGTRTSSNVTRSKRRVTSTVRMGSIVSPGASAGTSTCVSPAPVRPVTSRWRAWAADSTGRLTPSSTTSSPSARTSRATVPSEAFGAGSAQAPGGHGLSSEQLAEDPGPAVAVVLAEGRRHHVDGHERTRGGVAPEGRRPPG